MEPASPRDSAKLLVLGPALDDRRVSDLPGLLEPGDLLVVNDTKVRRARVFGHRPTGGRVELLLLKRLAAGGEYESLVRAHKRLRPGETVSLDGGQGLIGMRERVQLFGGTLESRARPGGGFVVRARLPVTEEAPA